MLKRKPKCCLKPSFLQNQTSVYLEHLYQKQTPAWNTYSRTRHQSGTLIAEPDTCLEQCLDSNNTCTNYSCGHPISVDSLLLFPVTIYLRLNFYHFLPDSCFLAPIYWMSQMYGACFPDNCCYENE